MKKENTKFKYQDKVEITNGFYRGLKGTIIDKDRYAGSKIKTYKMKPTSTGFTITNISDEDLKYWEQEPYTINFSSFVWGIFFGCIIMFFIWLNIIIWTRILTM